MVEGDVKIIALSNSDLTPFQAYSSSHWCVLILTVLVTVVMVVLARKNPTGKTAPTLGYMLAGIILFNLLALLFHGINRVGTTWVDLLPMQLCDWLSFIAPAALIWRKQWLYEITYFLGVAGTLHGLITPDLQYSYPHFYFFTFFIGHAGIVIAAAYLSFGLSFRPYPRSIFRALVFIQFYFITAALVNFLLDTNFGYLRAKPLNPSLIDYLGPWPWYLVSLELLALLSFFICYAPWFLYDKIKKRA